MQPTCRNNKLFFKINFLSSSFPKDAYSFGDENYLSKYSLKNISNPIGVQDQFMDESNHGG
jgi:hypothetical protein